MIIHLGEHAGYRRDQLKVQVTSKPALKLMGERLIVGNRWRRFSLEFPIPSEYDTDDVTATFEGGRLSIKFGKLIKPKETTTAPPEEAPMPQEPSQKVAEQKTAQESPKAKQDTEAARTNEVSEQKTPQKTAQEDAPEAKQDKEEPRTDEVSEQKTLQKEVKESTAEMEKSKTEKAASTERVAEEVKTSGLTEKTEAAISKAPKTKSAKSVTRSITRLVDFTLCFEPANQADNEGLGDMAAGFNKSKKLVKWGILILLVVGLGLYYRNAFRSSHGEWNFQEL